MIVLGNLLEGLQGLDALFSGLLSVFLIVLSLAFFLAMVLLIVFWGAISSFFGSIVGSALNRTIAEREYIQQTQGSSEPGSPYDTEGQADILERPALRGCGFQFLSTVVAAGTFYIMFGVFAEQRFDESEAGWSIVVSLVNAATAYAIRQQKRRRTLPEHLSEQGRFRLYLTWFYLCLFGNVVLAGGFGIGVLYVSAIASAAVFVYQQVLKGEREEPRHSERDDARG